MASFEGNKLSVNVESIHNKDYISHRDLSAMSCNAVHPCTLPLEMALHYKVL